MAFSKYLNGGSMHKKILLFVITAALSSNAFSDIIVTAPPISTKINMERSFRPLIRSMSKALDERISYQHPDNWLVYSHDIRAETSEIMLSEAHILALSLLFQNSGGMSHVPLTTMAGEKQLYLISDPQLINKPRQLAFKNICVKPSPSIDSVQLYRLFSNPVSQPNIVEIRGSYADIQAAMQKGRCIAMVSNSVPSTDMLNQHVVHSFPAIPQIGWTMSSKLPPNTKDKLREFFNAEENQVLINAVFQAVSESPTPPVATPFSAERYKDLDKLLIQVWGW